MNLFQQLQHQVRQMAAYERMEFEYEQSRKPSAFERFCIDLGCWRDIFGGVARALTCRVIGHDWTVEADIGPNSGSEHFYCRRCGESHKHIYY